MKLTLERLDQRDLPAVIVGGTQATDVVQGNSDTCAWAAGMAAVAARRDDTIAHDIVSLGHHRYAVTLHDPQNGQPIVINVRYARPAPADPLLRRNETWPAILQRAYLTLEPQAVNHGDSLARVLYIITGRVPVENDYARKDEVFAALAAGKTCLTQDYDHAFAVLNAGPDGVVMYNPHGFVQRVRWADFYATFYGITAA